jgi:hypothetical protein
MDRPVIINRRVLQDLEFAGLFPVSGYDMLDDVLLRYLVPDAAAATVDGLRLAVLVVIQHGSRYLIIDDNGMHSMGMVRECFHPDDEPVRSVCSLAVQAAQTLVEYYVPRTHYLLDVLGLMQCEQQVGGQEWLGCLFIAEISSAPEPRNIGTKTVSMMSIGQIRELLGADWGLDLATLVRRCTGVS